MTRYKGVIGLVAASVLTLPASALAQVAAEPQAAPAIQVAPPAPFETSALGDQTLGGIAGREDTGQLAINDQNANVTRNSVGDNVQTGDARIADNAFQNMSGLSILNVNTGNNVAINAAMSVNIAISPGQ